MEKVFTSNGRTYGSRNETISRRKCAVSMEMVKMSAAVHYGETSGGISTSPNLSWLPDSVLLEVLSFLSVRDLIRSCRVCKRWKRLILDKSLWRYVDLTPYKVRFSPMVVVFVHSDTDNDVARCSVAVWSLESCHTDSSPATNDAGNQGKHRVTKRRAALSNPMFTMVTIVKVKNNKTLHTYLQLSVLGALLSCTDCDHSGRKAER
ncbi:unnamed protein product [Ranitomeya imitator]|uniref:F-box domain-containing protein n=1 Tax=Ranitomeya imitator TaxID=111125 RepID=A0ABN9MML4_9NEOB|nr:unnamed protein product [Ranitomeya imitator]